MHQIELAICAERLAEHISGLRRFAVFLEKQLILHNQMKNHFHSVYSAGRSLKFLESKSRAGDWSQFQEKSPKLTRSINVEGEAKFIDELLMKMPAEHLLKRLENRLLERFDPRDEEFITRLNLSVRQISERDSVLRMAAVFLEILELFDLLRRHPEVLPGSCDAQVIDLLSTPLEAIFLDFE